MEFLIHEVYHEYEKCKQSFFDTEFKSARHKVEEGINDDVVANFHPVFLSCILNQQVFKRDVMEQDIRERMVEASNRATNFNAPIKNEDPDK